MLLGDLTEATATRLRSLGQNRTVQAAADLFSDRRFGLIAVCDEAGRTLGVISKSDLVRHLAGGRPVDTPVSAVMSRAVVSAGPADDLRATWKLMTAQRLQNLPLLDAERRPVGILDIRDALQAVLAYEEAQENQLVNYIAGIGYR